MKAYRVPPLALTGGHPSQRRARSTTTESALHLRGIAAAPMVGAITAVGVSIRGRFRANITAPIAIHMTITGYIANIAIDLLHS